MINDIEKYNKITSKLKELNLVTYEFTYEYFLKKQSKRYTDTKIIFVCNECGERFERSYANIIKEDRNKVCLKCCKKKKKTNILSIDEIRNRVDKKGLKLLSDEYKGEESPISVMCSCGNEYITTYASIRNSARTDGICRCKECANEYSRNYFRMNFEDLIVYFKENGCEVLFNEDEYINIFSEIEFIAACGHIHKTTFQSFKNSKFKLCSDCVKSIHCGNKSYNWNGGYVSENIKFRRTYEFKQWVKSVYKRDDYTCQHCRKRSGKLNSHHLDGYNWCLEKRTDTDNGVTLCEDCHKKFHHIYGYGNNTKEQFKEWIKDNKIDCIKDVQLQIV